MDTTSGGVTSPKGAVSTVFSLFRGGVWLLSAALLLFAAACYWGRYDACVFVTLFPPWCWAAGGVFLTWLAFSRGRWMVSTILVAGWLAFLVAFADTPSSFLRACFPQPERGTNLRVVSLNCAGQADAARAVSALDPDVVLIQESFMHSALDDLAKKLFGSSANLVRSVDASILARGYVTAVEVPPQFRGNFVHARVQLDERTINVISLRLFPCPIRFDFWSRDAWRYYQVNRENRRRELTQIADCIKTLSADEPLIVGGDFNCPPRDAVLRLLEPRLTDAFAAAGRGWGASIIELSGWPLIRIDQIWTSEQLRATCAFAAAAEPSDHHMMVADFSLKPEPN